MRCWHSFMDLHSISLASQTWAALSAASSSPRMSKSMPDILNEWLLPGSLPCLYLSRQSCAALSCFRRTPHSGQKGSESCSDGMGHRRRSQHYEPYPGGSESEDRTLAKKCRTPAPTVVTSNSSTVCYRSSKKSKQETTAYKLFWTRMRTSRKASAACSSLQSATKSIEGRVNHECQRRLIIYSGFFRPHQSVYGRMISTGTPGGWDSGAERNGNLT